MRARWFSMFWMISSLVLVTCWGFGQIVRDRSWLTGIMFYCPSPVVCLWLTVAAWRSRPPDAPKTNRRICLALLVLPLCAVGLLENQWGIRPERSESTRSDSTTRENSRKKEVVRLRLVHWNLCRPEARWERQKQWIRSLDADVIVLSEISESVLDEDFEPYSIVRRGSMLVAAKWPIDATGSQVRGGAMHAFCVRALEQGKFPAIMIADMTSALRLARDPYLRPLIARSVELQADIVVGDLNAPRRSLALSDLPPGYRHAYDSVGAGWSYTWPMPFPIMAIDHCMCGPRVQPVEYQLQSSVLSDHRLQILDFDFTVSQ